MQAKKEINENIFSSKPLPAINERVKTLIDYYAGGSVKRFSEMIKLSSSQKLNRIFNIDRRNGEYPEVSSDVLLSTANMFSDIDAGWLLTGQGSMLRAEPSQVSPTPPVQENSGEVAAYYRMYKEKDEENKELLKENAVLKERLRLYEAEYPDIKKDVKDVSTGSHLYQDNPPATSAGAHSRK